MSGLHQMTFNEVVEQAIRSFPWYEYGLTLRIEGKERTYAQLDDGWVEALAEHIRKEFID